MKHFRPLIIATAGLALIISACSTPDDLAAPDLGPQFGTRGYDEVTDVAYGKALTLYAVGTLNSRYEYRNDASLHSQDAFVRRYDRNGGLVWESYLDIEPAYENNDYYEGYVPSLTARAVAVDGSGNALVAWSAEYLQLVYDELNNRSRYEVAATFNYLTKYSPSGRKVWRVYTNSALTDLAIDGSGNIYATSDRVLTKYTSAGAQSWTRSNSGTPSGVTVSSTNNVYIVRWDGAVVKYNASGTQLWLRTGALDAASGGYYFMGEGYKIAAGLSDELYVTGVRFGGAYEGCDASYFVESYTVRAFKLSNTGTRQWVKDVASGTLEDGDHSCSGDYITSLSGLGVAADNKGNVYIAGYQDSSNYYQDGFVAKYSRAGARAWKKGFGTSKADTATSVASYDGSEVFIGGVTNGFLVHRQLGGGDAVMREVNSSGNLVWAR